MFEILEPERLYVVLCTEYESDHLRVPIPMSEYLGSKETHALIVA